MPFPPRPDRVPRTVLAAFLVLTLALLAGGASFYLAEKERIHQEEGEDLSAIADLKASQILEWWQERLGDAAVMRADQGLAREAARVIASPKGSRAEKEMVAWAERVRATFDYRSVLLLDPAGAVRAGAGADRDRISPETRGAAMEAAASGKVTTVDLHFGAGGKLALDVLAPLLADGERGRVTGVVLLRIEPRTFLYPLIQRWPTSSPSGETLLVRREGDDLVYLNQLRHAADAPLTLRRSVRLPALIAGQAILGQVGLVEGVDYRGVPGMGAVRRIPGTPWFLVAKVDLEEINRPVIERARIVVVVVALLILASWTWVLLLGKRRQSDLYRRLFEAETERKALERHFGWLTRYANDIILLSDESGRVVEANERALSSYGYSPDEMAGMDLHRLLAPAHVGDIDSHRGRAWKSGGAVYETMHRRKDGSLFPVEVSTRVIETGGGAGGYTQDIVRDITERREVEEELHHAMTELEQKNRELEAFTRTAAHDLRQPLTVVKGYIQYLRKALDRSLSADHRQAFEQVLVSVDHLNRLLEDLLALARMESRVESAEPVPLGPLLEDVSRGFADQLAACQGEVVVEEGLPEIYLSPSRARELFENLLSNAVKYCRPGVPLRVEVGREKEGRGVEGSGRRWFTFRDNGKGIPPEEQERVFDLFFRGKGETATGTGLGLAIVKRIVERAGGSIRVESAPGEGTAFHFTLPVAPPAPRGGGGII